MTKTVTFVHKALGPVAYDDQCRALQSQNPDPTTIIVFHDWAYKEVSRNMLSGISVEIE